MVVRKKPQDKVIIGWYYYINRNCNRGQNGVNAIWNCFIKKEKMLWVPDRQVKSAVAL